MQTTFGGSQIPTTGIPTDWHFHETAHGKDDSDPDLGKCKSAGSDHQMAAEHGEVGKLYSAQDFHDFLKKKMEFPKKTIYTKKGVGLFKRVFHFIPISGPLSVNRRIQKCDTVKGTKKLHEIRNVRQEGFIQTRLGSCFQCFDCSQGLLEQCKNADRVGLPLLVQLNPTQAGTRMITRNVLKQQSLAMAQQSLFGDFLAIELYNNNEACFMIGMVVGAIHKATEDIENWAGNIAQNSNIIELQRLCPVAPGSTVFQLSDQVLLANAEHIISGKLHFEVLECPNGATKYKLDGDQHNLLLRSLQKNDNLEAELTSLSDGHIKPGDNNFDHKILLNLKLNVPCRTWDHESARNYFGAQYRQKNTTAYVAKIKNPNTKKVKFILRFLEIPENDWKNWEFGLDYVLQYVCNLEL